MTILILNQIISCNIAIRFSRLLSTSRSRNEYDVAIVGGGIVGCATAREILMRNKNLNVILLEKENEIGIHQTGHNSGVIHAGIYYKPGSLKAKLCAQGLQQCYKYCDEKNIQYKKCGKIIVATTPEEVKQLNELEKRGRLNNVPDLQVLNGKEIQEVEPYCRGLKALWSPHTGIVNFIEMCKSYAYDFQQLGGTIVRKFEVSDFNASEDPNTPVRVLNKNGQWINTKYVVTCGGLYADKLACLSKCSLDPKIIPFRGEYLKLHESKNYLVKGNIYPVPDPRFPFLGVHFTPRMDGSILLGPNAVLGLCREGYSWTDFKVKEFLEIISYSGFRSLAGKYVSKGIQEVTKSLIPALTVKDVKKFIPELETCHVTRSLAGVRAQALMVDGSLVDDFVFSRGTGNIGTRVLHVRNAPSPAATSSLPIANFLVNKIQEEFGIIGTHM